VGYYKRKFGRDGKPAVAAQGVRQS
jgi:hypothetical protein